MPRLTTTHLTAEVVGCTGRYHRTYTAAKKAGCLCPTATAALQDKRRELRANRPSRAVDVQRKDDVDPRAVEYAIAGKFTAKQLTSAERRIVVTHLIQVKRMTDQAIANWLNWSGGSRRGKNAVVKFRRIWKIAAANPPKARTSNDGSRRTAAA